MYSTGQSIATSLTGTFEEAYAKLDEQKLTIYQDIKAVFADSIEAMTKQLEEERKEHAATRKDMVDAIQKVSVYLRPHADRRHAARTCTCMRARGVLIRVPPSAS